MEVQIVEKSYKKLKYLFTLNMIVMVLSYLLLHIFKINIFADSVVLEQYVIILTIAGVPLSLKLFHYQFKKIVGTDNIKKYKSIYYLRLLLIDSLIVLNSICLFLTGSNNFSFLSIIVIFALFLCLPNKHQLESIQEKTNE